MSIITPRFQACATWQTEVLVAEPGNTGGKLRHSFFAGRQKQR